MIISYEIAFFSVFVTLLCLYVVPFLISYVKKYMLNKENEHQKLVDCHNATITEHNQKKKEYEDDLYKYNVLHQSINDLKDDLDKKYQEKNDEMINAYIDAENHKTLLIYNKYKHDVAKSYLSVVANNFHAHMSSKADAFLLDKSINKIKEVFSKDL